MTRAPRLREDVRNILVIGGSALAGVVLLTAVSLAGRSFSPRSPWSAASTPAEAPSDAVGFPTDGYEVVEPLSGSNRLYGTVRSKRGEVYEGFLRWDRNEGSWGDLLDGTKLADGRTALSGVRFGHVRSIQPVGHDQAILALRSGQTVDMSARGTDLGSRFRGLVVTDFRDGAVHRGDVELEWDEVAEVEFAAAPAGTDPPGSRLHGTLVTRSGMTVTGYVTWDVDEIHSADELDGDAGGRRFEVPFGAIASIRQAGSRGAEVTLHTGEAVVLHGTNDVNAENRGIAVSDPGLGAVSVEWSEFESVRFHAPENEESYGDFDGGRPLRGVVLTVSGDELSGNVRWDRDEARSWEVLNGRAAGAEFFVEFSKIARIERVGDGAEVTLRDGRRIHLKGSNDVDDGNRGIVVESDGRSRTVAWGDFVGLRLER